MQSSNTTLHLSKRGQKVPSKMICVSPYNTVLPPGQEVLLDFLPLPLKIRRQSRNPVMTITRQRCVSLGSMRHIRHTATWCPWTDGTVWTLGGRGPWRGISPTLWSRTLEQCIVTDRARWREEGGRQSCNSGLGTYTRGWDVLSSYVYYYFFQQSCKRQSDTEFNETSVKVGWQRALLLTQASGKSRNGWFHRWACLLFCFKKKGFLREQLYLQQWFIWVQLGYLKRKKAYIQKTGKAPLSPHGTQVLNTHWFWAC